MRRKIVGKLLGSWRGEQRKIRAGFNVIEDMVEAREDEDHLDILKANAEDLFSSYYVMQCKRLMLQRHNQPRFLTSLPNNVHL